MKCWICNVNEADSEEHKFKASDIKKNFGKKFDGIYFNDSYPKPITLTSYKDELLKFPKIICIDCNYNRTRRADEAYDLFFNEWSLYMDDSEKNGSINFNQIFKDNWLKRKLDLYRYFAKHAGCKIMTSEMFEEIDISPLSAFILGGNEIRNFKLEFYYNPAARTFIDYLEKHPVDRLQTTLAFGATLFKRDENNIKFYGTIINGPLRIEWYYTNKKNLLSKIDLDTQIEKLTLMDFETFYPRSFKEFPDETLWSYFNFGRFSYDKKAEEEYVIEKFNSL